MSKKKLVPYSTRVLIKPEDKLSKTAGGIIIPDTVIQKPSRGVIVSVGPDCKEAKIGDDALFGKDAGLPITVDGNEYILIRESELMLRYG